MKRVKLWKVVVRDLGRDYPQALYFVSREAAELERSMHACADPVRYAGMFTLMNARNMLIAQLFSNRLLSLRGCSRTAAIDKIILMFDHCMSED